MNKPINYITTLFFIAIILFISACLDEYNPPEIANSDTILVVEGNITDTETTIRLTQTNNLGEQMLLPVENAVVKLENESSSFQFNLQPEGQGFYTAIASLNHNDKYRIHIQSEGDEYVSEFLSLLSTPPIDSVGWEDVDDKFQVQISTTGNENFSKYYLWKFEETWRYSSKYSSMFIYKDGKVLPRTADEQITTCWNTLSSTAIQIGTSINLNQNVVFKQPIHEIDPSQNLKLSTRYSILVKQYAISKEAFEFWDLLKKNTESVGTFFDPQPSQLPTNLRCINNPDKPVIGFLSASQEQMERMFVNRSELPFTNFAILPICDRDTISLDPIELSNAFSSGIRLITTSVVSGIQTVGYETMSRQCLDCRLLEDGGTTEEPSFW